MSDKEAYDPQLLELRQLTDHLFEVDHPFGSCSFMIDPNSGQLSIDWIEVQEQGEHRERGIAQNMLRYTRDTASQLGARVITATIVSRESLTAFTRVFGEDAIRIEKLGRYEDPRPDEPQAPHRHTKAFLEYVVGQDEPPVEITPSS